MGQCRERSGISATMNPTAVPNDFRFGGTGVLRYLSGGLTLTLYDLAWLMIIGSDNVATALVLLEIGGPGAVNRTKLTSA